MKFLFSCHRFAVVFLVGTSLPTLYSFPWKDAGDNEYEPPQEGQLRSPCPAINVVANHGFIDRSGKNIPLKNLTLALETVFGVPSAAILPAISLALPLLGIETEKTEKGQTINLDALYKHMGFEHDASMVREDLYFAGDRAPFSQELFDQCVDTSSDDFMSVFEVASCNRLRILDSRSLNPTAYDFLGINIGGIFAAGEAAALMLFGNDPKFLQVSKENLESILKFNRIPDGYQTRTLPELVPILYPVTVCLTSGVKALLMPIKKSDGSISAPEIPENWISAVKTLMVAYSSEIPKPFVAVVEAVIAELEELAHSQNLEAHI